MPKSMYVEKEIKRCVSDIWENYDDDENLTLDRDEIKEIVIDSLKEIGEDVKIVSDRDFNELFLKMDRKCRGVIDQDDMFQFIKTVSENTDF